MLGFDLVADEIRSGFEIPFQISGGAWTECLGVHCFHCAVVDHCAFIFGTLSLVYDRGIA